MTETKKVRDGRSEEKKKEVLSTYCVSEQQEAFLSHPRCWKSSQPPFKAGLIFPI